MKRIADKRIVVDIETTLDHKTIWLCCTKDIDTGEKNTWYQAKAFQDYIEDATLLIGHNLISFDAYLLNSLWKTRIVLNKCYDTLLVSRLLNPSREGGHSLAAWGSTLNTQKIDYKATWEWMTGRREEYKGECYDKPIDGLLAVYCERDIDVTALLYEYLIAETSAQKFSQQSVKLEHSVAVCISKQERNGFKLDTPHAISLLTLLRGKLDGLYEAMQERWPPYDVERVSEKTGKPLKPARIVFNPGSRQQIGEKLIELGWKPATFTPTGQPIVDEGSLDGCNLQEAKLISEYLMLQKRIAQIESWLEALGDDGRVHGRVTTNGAVTGRATHSSPNLAQIPNSSSPYGVDCRQCWTVEDDRVLVGVDLSGIELRCLSHYMQDEEWQRELLEGDVHWKNTQAFGLVPMGTVKEDTKEHKDARNVSKTLTYATLYGAGAGKLGGIVGKSKKAGAELSENFMNNTPSLKKLKEMVDHISSSGSVPGLDGRRILVRSEHAALNSLLQSAGAIIAKQWIVCLTRNLANRKIDYKLVAFVHDEVCIEAFEKDAEEVVKIVVESAAEAGALLKFRCPVGAEGHIGKTWADVH
jgi:DNA polymerase I-like protein with 3'-5' exonuclease and polymerase domains